MQLAVQNNLSITLRRQQLGAARAGVPASKGRFEPAVTGLALHSDTNTPPTTVQEGSAGQVLNATNDTWNLGVSERIRSGTVFGLDFTNARSQSSLGTAVQPLIYRSGVNLKLTQPLLRGFAFSFDVPYVEVLRAEFASERAKQDVLGQLVTTVKETELAYWDVVLALKTYQVQRGSLALGQEQLALTRRQIDAGILPPSDLINAEGTLAQRELGLVQSEANIEQAADVLRKALNLPRHTWTQAILPVDPPRFDDRPVTFEQAVQRALHNRPELKQRQLDIEKAQLDTKVAGTERLPQLDAQLTYGLLGQRSTYSGAIDQLTTANAPVWTASLNLSWTPFNVAANGQLDARRATEGAARTLLDQQLLDLHTEIRAALRALNTAVRAVRAAGNFRVLAERSLDAEQRKFMNGTSSNFFIAQRQNDVAQAQLAELVALVQHQKAVTTLQAAMGVLLEDRSVQLDVRGR
jgi:outer membrane protein TolC